MSVFVFLFFCLFLKNNTSHGPLQHTQARNETRQYTYYLDRNGLMILAFLRLLYVFIMDLIIFIMKMDNFDQNIWIKKKNFRLEKLHTFMKSQDIEKENAMRWE